MRGILEQSDDDLVLARDRRQLRVVGIGDGDRLDVEVGLLGRDVLDERRVGEHHVDATGDEIADHGVAGVVELEVGVERL